MTMIGRQLEQRLPDILTDYPSIDLVYLFGSQATGRAGPMSDYDVGVVLSRDHVARSMDADQSFRFGSFMFANLAAQIAGYYALAAALIPLGYGHLARRRWVRPLALALLGFWRLLGLPLSVVFLLVLIASKEVTPAFVIVVVLLLAGAYLVLPGLLRRFYCSRDLRLTLEARAEVAGWLERLPTSILTLCLLYLFYGIVLHIPILLNGLYPLYGSFLSGLPGIRALDLSILALGFLTWGTFKRRAWAWWGGLAYWGWLALSTIVTFAKELGIKTIGEFVESKEVYDFITQMGIDYSQGHFFGAAEPTPADPETHLSR